MTDIVQDPGKPREHNHISRFMQPKGECPACDYLYTSLENSKFHGDPEVGKRAAAAAEYLLQSGPGPFNTIFKDDAASRFGSSRSSVARALAIRSRSEPVFESLKRGELTIAEASRKAGFIEYSGDTRHLSGSTGVFGKGDKFWEAAGPISAYLKAWKKKDYLFTHVPPKEASRRLTKIDQLIEGLESARVDLVERSDKTSLRLPSK